MEAEICASNDLLVAAVRRRLNGQLRNFGVRVQDGGLTLQGCATTFYAKQLAQHIVMECSEMPIRANEIEVGATP